MIGEIFESNNCGKMEVVDVEGGGKYRVKFLSTGTEVITTATNIRKGAVKDRFYPIVAGVGYLGLATTTTNPKLYARWKRMLQACYDPFHVDYPSNGAIGVTVDPRWFSYENYQADIVDIWEKSGSPTKYRLFRAGSSFAPTTILLVAGK